MVGENDADLLPQQIKSSEALRLLVQSQQRIATTVPGIAKGALGDQEKECGSCWDKMGKIKTHRKQVLPHSFMSLLISHQ